MRWGLFWVFVAVFCALLACKKTQWQQLAPTDGGFSVSVPGKAEERSANSEDGPSKRYIVELNNGAAAYTIAVAERFRRQPPNPDEVLDQSVAAIATGKYSLQSKAAIAIDGYPGREFVARQEDGFTYSSRIYLVRTRIYQLVVAAETGAISDEDRRRFFDSFKLSKP